MERVLIIKNVSQMYLEDIIWRHAKKLDSLRSWHDLPSDKKIIFFDSYWVYMLLRDLCKEG